MSTQQAVNIEMQVQIPQQMFFDINSTNTLFKYEFDGTTSFTANTLPLKRIGNPIMRAGSFVEFELENLGTALAGLTIQLDYTTELPDDVINVTPGYEAFGLIELLSNKMPVLSTTGKFKAIEQYLRYEHEEQKMLKSIIEQPQILSTDPQLVPIQTEVDGKPVRRILIPLGLFFNDVNTPLLMDSIRSSKMTVRLQLNPNVPLYRAERDEDFELAPLYGSNGELVAGKTNAATLEPLVSKFVDVQMYGDYFQLCEAEAIAMSRPSRIFLYDDIIEIQPITIQRPQLAAGETASAITIATDLDSLSNNISCILFVLTADNVSVRTANFTTDVENKQCTSAQIMFNGRPRLPEAQPGYVFTQKWRRSLKKTVSYHLHPDLQGQLEQREFDQGKNILSAVHIYSWAFDIFSKQLTGVAHGNGYKIQLITTWTFSNPGAVTAPAQANVLQIYGIKKRVFGISNGQALPLDTPLS